MNNEFVSIKEVEPNVFDLCDIQVNNSTYFKFRYLKYDDGTSAWVNDRCLISSKHVSLWRLNKSHSDELTKQWLNSFKPLSEYPDLNKDNWPTITHTFEV